MVLLYLLGLYSFRFDLWHSYPAIRWMVRECLVLDPNLQRANKSDILKKLGPPDVQEGRYVWFPRNEFRPRGDLRFEVGASNEITRIHFLWGNWRPSKELPMDLKTWGHQDELTQWAMNADLVRRWPKGDFRGQLDKVGDVLKAFPGAVFIDYWGYASDGGSGIGGSLDFEFNEDGYVVRVRKGYID